MKLSSALILASMAASVSAGKTISSKTAAKVLRAARRVEDAAEGEEEAGDDAAQEDYSFLAQYNIKLIGCKAGEQVVDPETGEIEYSAAIFRLCPSEFGCDSESVTGCDSGYGDFEVGLNTFVDAYFEDQKDNMNWDDQVQVDRYAECAQYDVEANDDADEDPYDGYEFYIGPTCTEDELDIKLAVFSEYTCTTESSFTFEEISNGWTLPYEDGGVVSDYCLDCVEENENGEYELREMCQQLYEKTAYACEAEMEYYSYYGQNVQGCEYIEEIMPEAAKPKKGGKVFGWIFFILVVGGIAGYIMWWRSKKSTATTSASDGLVA